MNVLSIFFCTRTAAHITYYTMYVPHEEEMTYVFYVVYVPD